MATDVKIDIAAEFTGKKAFKQAETSADKLGKGVKRLAGALGLAFSTRAIVNFGRLAVKASLDQQAEQNRLNQLLKVGVGATTQEIALLNDQAAALEKIGVVAGGNITQTQSQLATFNLQVSTIEALTPAILDYVTAEKGATASTADFKSMTNGLAQALNGNFASLTRVGFVLDENTKKQIANGTEAERADALAIDKANLALNKGEEIFDMDKIQIAAALTSQAEQLGKATSSAQQLQIANDIARLTVKQSILALEDAIAAKDEQAIIAATNKLNADLKVLNVLSGQNVKLADIKSILDSLKPKDLINQANLDAALAKIKEMMALLAQATAQSTAKIPTSASLGSGIPVGDFIAPISREVGQAASMDALIEYSEAAQARANAFADLLDLDTAAKLAAIQQTSTGGGFDVGRFRMADNAGMSPVVNVYANTIANPDELTNLIQNSIIQLNKRGDYLTTAGAL
jgi:hypothetical protein